MKKELYKKQGTIANVLSKQENMEAILALVEQGDVREAKNKVINILDNAESLAKNSAVSACKARIMKAKNASHLMSTLTGYMTGCTV